MDTRPLLLERVVAHINVSLKPGSRTGENRLLERQAPMTATLDLEAARYRLGVSTGHDLVQAAEASMLAGEESFSLALLASEVDPIMSDAGPLFERALSELGVDVPELDAACWIVLHHLVTRIAEGEVRPRDGVQAILTDVYDPGGLYQGAGECLGDSHGIGEMLAYFYGLDDIATRPAEVSCDGKYGAEAIARVEAYIREHAEQWLVEHGPTGPAADRPGVRPGHLKGLGRSRSTDPPRSNMQWRETHADSSVWTARMDRPYRFTSPCSGEDFALLLVVGDDAVSVQEREDLSEEFVRQGCRHAVCFGADCSAWDDSIDMVSVMDEVQGRRGPFVMTTWHEHEPIEDVAEFFALNTAFDDWTPRRFVVFIVGGSSEFEAKVHTAVEGAFAKESSTTRRATEAVWGLVILLVAAGVLAWIAFSYTLADQPPDYPWWWAVILVAVWAHALRVGINRFRGVRL